MMFDVWNCRYHITNEVIKKVIPHVDPKGEHLDEDRRWHSGCKLSAYVIADPILPTGRKPWKVQLGGVRGGGASACQDHVQPLVGRTASNLHKVARDGARPQTLKSFA